MEVLNMNPNPVKSTQNQKQMINNPFYPIMPSGSLFVDYPNQATRALIYAMPYGKDTLAQTFKNIQNFELLKGTKNMQSFGQVIMPQSIAHFPRV
jgi:hypothetical protein